MVEGESDSESESDERMRLSWGVCPFISSRSSWELFSSPFRKDIVIEKVIEDELLVVEILLACLTFLFQFNKNS